MTMKCPHCECEFLEGSFKTVNGVKYCESCYHDDTFSCDYCGERCANNDAVKDEDGNHYCSDDCMAEAEQDARDYAEHIRLESHPSNFI